MLIGCSNYVDNQFIIAIRHLWGVGGMANIPQQIHLAYYS